MPGPGRLPETTYDPRVLTRQARGICIPGYQVRVDYLKLPTTLESLPVKHVVFVFPDARSG